MLLVVSAPVEIVPEVARSPVHAPLAVQLVAMVVDHVSSLDPPVAKLVGLAVIVTTGGVGVGVGGVDAGAAVTITD